MNIDDIDFEHALESDFTINRVARRPASHRKARDHSKRLAQAVYDDFHHLAPQETLNMNEPILGVYSTKEWIVNRALRQRFLDGATTLVQKGTWITPSKFDLGEWVQSQGLVNYTFFSSTQVLVTPKNSGLIDITVSNGRMEVELTGQPDFCETWLAVFDDCFKRAESLIRWAHSERGEIAVPLNFKPAIQAAYPWLPAGTDEYIDRYLESDASIIILIGPPGTGKTTFIKNLIHRSGSDALVTYDEKVMSQDSFFARFIDDECKFLVMEDADAFLSARTEGNTMMHRFLNVSDGLISTAGKKLIFSTNLPSIRDVDAALTRPGRCYDIVEFRALNCVESSAVLDEIGSNRAMPDGNAFTLAELLNQQPSHANTTSLSRPVGFHSRSNA